MGKENKNENTDRIINKVRVLMGSKKYIEAIRWGLFLYNRNFKEIDRYSKYIISFNLALCYKKNDMLEESLSFLEVSIKYRNEEEQGYYQILWLMNNCEIELGIDKKKQIIHRFNLCLKYYKLIKDRQMIANMLYNISKYKNRLNSMFRGFKSIIKEDDLVIEVFVSYNKREEVISILNDFKNMDVEFYKKANNYLEIQMETINSI